MTDYTTKYGTLTKVFLFEALKRSGMSDESAERTATKILREAHRRDADRKEDADLDRPNP